jgi:glutaredoxin
MPQRLTRTEWLVAIVAMALAFGLGGWLKQSQPPGTADQAAQLRAAIRPGELQMISSVSCGYCHKARVWLTEAQVPFEECFVEREAVCRQRFARTGAKATPTFVLHGQAVLGLDPATLLSIAEAQRRQ